MSRTGPQARSRLSVQEKTRVVLAVLAGEMTLAEAARLTLPQQLRARGSFYYSISSGVM